MSNVSQLLSVWEVAERRREVVQAVVDDHLFWTEDTLWCGDLSLDHIRSRLWL